MTTHEKTQYHDTIEFFALVRERIYDQVAPLYDDGWSLRDIEAHTGIAKTNVRKALLDNGVRLRGNTSTAKFDLRKSKSKQAALPIYGFHYFQGKIVPHPKEHEVLLFIIKQWQKGDNANVIFKKLNSKGYPSRKGKEWSWNAVQNILDRLNKKRIVVVEGRRCEILST